MSLYEGKLCAHVANYSMNLIVGNSIMVKLGLRIFGYVLGVCCYLVGSYGIVMRKRRLVKFKWLGHYLVGEGSPLTLPVWLIEQDQTLTNEDVLRLNNGNVVEPWDRHTDNAVFYCIGRFTVHYDDTSRALNSIDVYDFSRNAVRHPGDSDYDMFIPFCGYKCSFLGGLLHILDKYCRHSLTQLHLFVTVNTAEEVLLQASDIWFAEIFTGTPFETTISYTFSGERDAHNGFPF
jgi:hypothetical protein